MGVCGYVSKTHPRLLTELFYSSFKLSHIYFYMFYSQLHVAQRLSFSEKKHRNILPITAFYSRFHSVASAVMMGSG